MTDKITIERETLERAIAYLEAPTAKLWPAGTLHGIAASLRAALAAQPAEPVAWRWKERVNGMSDSDWTVTNVEPPDGVRVIAKEPLYAAQPAPAAVPLTDEQINDIYFDMLRKTRGETQSILLFARAVLAAAGEKP